MVEQNYVTRVYTEPLAVDAVAWDALLARQARPTPFMLHAYLAALHASGSASAETGWTPTFLTLELDGALAAACVVYTKTHSYGEYVFDWAWANAYQQHGVPYYPKAVVAVPFTPVPGSRLLARDGAARDALVAALLAWSRQTGVSSLHLLFGDAEDIASCERGAMMPRHSVQFHWHNTRPGYANFDAFLISLNQEKRKKIRQEQRKVIEAGVTFRALQGTDITPQAWDFFYRCYAKTYYEHGNAPYLAPEFFHAMSQTIPQHWLLFLALREGQPIACSLIALGSEPSAHAEHPDQRVAFGRYWGSLEPVDCLHFDACYYQPVKWCIDNGYVRFEGGAQGEHKMARALMPVKTTSAHWLAHPAFADAVGQFLEREGRGIENYMDVLGRRTPFRQGPLPAGEDPR